MYFSVAANYGVKIKESEKISRGLKKRLENMRVTVISVVVGAPEAVTKDLEKSLEELEIKRIEIFQTTVF